MSEQFDGLVTERLVLRYPRRSDVESMYAHRTHPDVIQFAVWEPKSAVDVEAFVDTNAKKQLGDVGWHQLVITLADGGTFIGDCGFNIQELDSRIVEIGITINPSHHRKGYATETLSALTTYLFSALKKHRVYASIDPDNVASMTLFRRLGFRKEAHFVQSYWFKERWVDDVIFAVLADEWLALSVEQSSETIPDKTEVSILQVLYAARKKNPQHGGASGKFLCDILDLSLDACENSLNSLLRKGFIEIGRRVFQITAPGVDYVEKNWPDSDRPGGPCDPSAPSGPPDTQPPLTGPDGGAGVPRKPAPDDRAGEIALALPKQEQP